MDVLAGAGVRFLEPADACEVPNTIPSPRAFEVALLKAPEGVGGTGMLSIASPGRCGGFPVLFRFSRPDAMVSILKKRRRGQITIDYHNEGFFPIATMVFAD
jgi:hypothetical protein